jgi:hypothetical protein
VWAPAETLVRVRGQRPYVKVACDAVATIHVPFTDCHPRETATSLFYARYVGGAWFRAGGARIGGPPFTPADADLVWDVARTGQHAWVHDVAFDHANPAVLYLLRQVAGQWQVERWETADGGATWRHRSLTAGSLEKNVRPVCARGGGPLWMRGGYVKLPALPHHRYRRVTSRVQRALRRGRALGCAQNRLNSRVS